MNTDVPSQKKRRQNWGEVQIDFMLNIMRDKKILRILDRNGHIFKLVEEEFKKRGFIKSAEQIRIKRKHLKSVYYQVKRQNLASAASRNECPHWNLLEKLLSDVPSQLPPHLLGWNRRS
jgi:hypothetical protein